MVLSLKLEKEETLVTNQRRAVDSWRDDGIAATFIGAPMLAFYCLAIIALIFNPDLFKNWSRSEFLGAVCLLAIPIGIIQIKAWTWVLKKYFDY